MSTDPKPLVHVVDDDDAIRDALGFMLRTAGYEVKSFSSGSDLMSRIDELGAGCILLDIRMPGMDGLETQQGLKDRGADQPVIIMTGHGDVNLAVKAMKAGAIDFIEKPFENHVLIGAIDEALSQLASDGSQHNRRKAAIERLKTLSAREREVLDGLAAGCPNKAIAYDLGISIRTVEVHRANLMSKLGARSLSEALRLAFAAGGE